MNVSSCSYLREPVYIVDPVELLVLLLDEQRLRLRQAREEAKEAVDIHAGQEQVVEHHGLEKNSNYYYCYMVCFQQVILNMQ